MLLLNRPDLLDRMGLHYMANGIREADKEFKQKLDMYKLNMYKDQKIEEMQKGIYYLKAEVEKALSRKVESDNDYFY